MYVPMPPFQNRSTGASSTARIRSFGVIVSTPSSMPSASRICGVSLICLAEREKTPPPSEMRSRE